MDNKISAFLLTYSDPLLGEVMGCDIHLLDEAATVADLMDALDDFAAQYMADCYGCDACCQERAPLTAADIPALAALLPQSDFPAHAVVSNFGKLDVTDGVTDIILRRGDDNCCCMLNTEGHFCNQWPARAFVCRSHFCLPRSKRLEELRQAIVNAGENELTRMLLKEEMLGAPPVNGQKLCQQICAEDYPTSAISDILSYKDMLIRDVVSAELWQQLLA